MAAIEAGISSCCRSQEFSQIITEGLVDFANDTHLLIPSISGENNMLQKLRFHETRRTWQAVIKGFFLFCILYLQS